MGSLDKEYSKILDDGYSITELYIYACVVEDDRCYGLSTKEMEDKVYKIQELRSSTSLSLDEIIDKVLNGEEDYDEGDMEWY
jgi:hypothetical protein